MKKIPTLFEREFQNGKVVGITDTVRPGLEWVLEGEGDATVKWDGSACAFIGGKFYKRYDCKKGKTPPQGAIPCSDPDPVTGHWPHWVKVDPDNPGDKWFRAAYAHALLTPGRNGTHQIDAAAHSPAMVTFEAIGLHFNGNPYGLNFDTLIKHGADIVTVERSFEGIREFLAANQIEGLVFWRDGEPQCKIKRRDFGFEWPVKDKEGQA